MEEFIRNSPAMFGKLPEALQPARVVYLEEVLGYCRDRIERQA